MYNCPTAGEDDNGFSFKGKASHSFEAEEIK